MDASNLKNVLQRAKRLTDMDASGQINMIFHLLIKPIINQFIRISLSQEEIHQCQKRY